jgi:hypothetical protein
MTLEVSGDALSNFTVKFCGAEGLSRTAVTSHSGRRCPSAVESAGNKMDSTGYFVGVN